MSDEPILIVTFRLDDLSLMADLAAAYVEESTSVEELKQAVRIQETITHALNSHLSMIEKLIEEQGEGGES